MPHKKMKDRRLVITSNRLPFVLERSRGKWQVIAGSGGLVTALAPVLRNRGGLWIGWPGTSEKADVERHVATASENAGFSMKPVLLSEHEVQQYYVGLSNEVIWPLFHDLQSCCNFDPGYWDMYVKINARFAGTIRDNTDPDDFIWVHDYHLICVASELRRLEVRNRNGFYLHIPFPHPDIFNKLPWRYEILRALLDFDLIGFQTLRDRRNFLQCLRVFIKDVSVKGKGQVLDVEFEDRIVRVGSFPISIDFSEFSQLAGSKEVADRAWYIHEDMPNRKIVLGVDRLDYTKGIIYRLRAFRKLLEMRPDLHKRITLAQIVVPSRRNIPVYEDLKEEIERLVSEINGEFTSPGWVPVYYVFRSLTRTELLAYYRTAEIALITPLKDGMNLVAKEYCASNTEQTGVLILSEFAGAAAQLQKSAIMVNPYNIVEIAEALNTAIEMPFKERKARMRKAQQVIAKYDIYWWVNSFLQAAISFDLDDFPLLDDYSPSFGEKR